MNDFTVMGSAIEQRHARCKAWWEPHLRCTREFIAQHIEDGSRVAILGAGRLFDLDLALLLERATEVHLFDADPACLSLWRAKAGSAFRRRVVPHIVDLTGILDEWTRPLRAVLRKGDLAGYLSELRAPEPTWAQGVFDGLISLNVAGQIPLYWRDRVLGFKASLTNQEHTALVHSMAELQSAHLRALSSAAGAFRILVTDTEYYYYESDCSVWEVEGALHGYSMSVFNQSFPKEGGESWLWHLAPQYIESDHEGEIHRVEARIIPRFCKAAPSTLDSVRDMT
jgi:hypothetical protein